MRIAIVAHNAYGMISGRRTGHIGGVERQTSMLARWLAGRGHQVSLITWDEGGPPTETFDNVRVIKTCARAAGVPFVRFFIPRWSSLNTALGAADAELYYQNGAEEVTGQVALWCRRHRRKFVFSVASDIDCNEWLHGGTSLREGMLYRYGLGAANRIIVQTGDQGRRLEQATGRPATILPMPGHDYGPGWGAPEGTPGKPPMLLLVGRIAPEKNIALFVEVAQRLPDFRFVVVGPGDPSDPYVPEVQEAARTVPNLEFFGAAGKQQLAELYRGATALCCTSHYEGFPNTFIEAWSAGLPVVSTVDPDGLIAREGLGAVAADSDAFCREISRLVQESGERAAVGVRARAWFERHHAIDVAMSRFERLFEETL